MIIDIYKMQGIACDILAAQILEKNPTSSIFALGIVVGTRERERERERERDTQKRDIYRYSCTSYLIVMLNIGQRYFYHVNIKVILGHKKRSQLLVFKAIGPPQFYLMTNLWPIIKEKVLPT